MTGGTQNQFSLTRAALSTRGAQKQISISQFKNGWQPANLSALILKPVK